MIRRKKRISAAVPTTSMGDIAFLLIIFFILASSFMKTANVESVPATSDSVETQEPAMVNVTLDIDGTLWLQGNPSSVPELEAAMQLQADELRESPVHVQIHKTHQRKDFMPVIEAISAAGVKMVLIGEKSDD